MAYSGSLHYIRTLYEGIVISEDFNSFFIISSSLGSRDLWLESVSFSMV